MITLINCASPNKKAVPPPGILSLAASLRKAGVETRILDLQVVPESESFEPEIVLELLGNPPQMVGFSTMSNMLPFALEAARILKENFPQTQIIFGGCGVQGVLQEVLSRFDYIDFAFHGESDISLPEFVKAWEAGKNWYDVPGLAFRDGSKVIVNPPPPRIQDLDNLPMPAYNLLDMTKYHAPISLMATRGCPFHCAYCDGGAFRGTQPVSRSSQSLLDEILMLASTYYRTKFSFVDDTFTAPPQKAEDFCRNYLERGCEFEWGALVRLDTISEPLMDLMAAAHCDALYFGIESGSENVLKAIGKRFRLSNVEHILSEAKKRFSFVITSFIWGFPFETVEDLKQTLLLASYFQTLNIGIQMHLWAPMPRSALFSAYRKELRFDPEILSNIVKSAFNISGFTDMIASDARIFAPFYHVPHPDFAGKREIIQTMGFQG